MCEHCWHFVSKSSNHHEEIMEYICCNCGQKMKYTMIQNKEYTTAYSTKEHGPYEPPRFSTFN